MSVTIVGIGRLGKEPKMQYTDGGTAKTFLNVATDAGFGDKKITNWLGLTAWGKLAETCNQYLQKGSMIAFTAELNELTTYEKQDGSTSPALYAKLLKVDFISGIAKGNETQTPYDGDNEPEDF